MIFLIVTCPTATAELSDVLNRPRIREKYHLTDQDIQDFVGQFSRKAILVPGTSVSGIVLADPKDDMFISCAVEGRARYIISLDHHLQELRRHGRIRIRTVARFLRTLERLERWRSDRCQGSTAGSIVLLTLMRYAPHLPESSCGPPSNCE